MNLKQMERVKEKIDEISEILNEDPAGTIDLHAKLDTFRAAVLEKLKHLVWEEYKSKRFTEVRD